MTFKLNRVSIVLFVDGESHSFDDITQIISKTREVKAL